MVVVALTLGAAAVGAPFALGLAVLAAGFVLAWGWAGALGLPSPYGTATVLAIGSVVLVNVVTADGTTRLTWMPAALGASVLITFAHQLLRRDGRPRLVESVAATLLGLAIIASGALLVPLALSSGTARIALAAMVAAAVAAVVELGGRWPELRAWTVPAALVAAGLAAVLTGIGSHQSWTTFLLIGMAVAAVGLALRAVLSVAPTMAQARPRLVSAIASVLATGGVVYSIAFLTTDLIVI